jgi:predicted ATPase/DNA-binding SARP family transcriptional activator
MGLIVRLIGAFEIRYDHRLITLSSRSAQSLFSYLILTAGTAHRREKLAGMFWPDGSDEKARTYLRQALWLIRKSFSPFTKVDYIISDDINICFNLSAAYQLDVQNIKNLTEASPIDEMMAVLSSYQGDLLPGFYDDWVMQEREQLQVSYEQKMSRLLQSLEIEKRWPEIIDWSERWITFAQGPESAFRYLMVAYDGLGDRTKVASTYRRCVQVLRELDLEPSEQTRALAFKRTHILNIPISLTSFIGREQELMEVAGLLSKYRLVTLTGSGGVGKTRLSIQVVPDVLARFPDGVWFLDLAPLADPSLVPNTLATLLGFQEPAASNLAVTDQLIRYFKTRTALIIFDNCEHLIEACAQFVKSLLNSCENLSILATSREALRISGEIPYRVPSLEIPGVDRDLVLDDFLKMESVKLFAERAKVVSQGFTVDNGNASAIARICRQLDGIPLAIELAAARVNVLTAEQISQRLHDRFSLLTGGLRSSLPRHQTLRATIEWSYELLSEHERLIFRRLGVFTGGWHLGAAEEICSGDGIESSAILDLVSLLVDKSLVLVDTLKGEARYQFLETIRQYAYEMMVDSSDTIQLKGKHFAYFLKKAEEIEPYLTGVEQSNWMDYLDQEHENIRLALEWAIANKMGEEALRLFGALGWFWIVRCHFQEGAGWFRRMQELQVDVEKSVKAKALGHAGVILWIYQDLPAARNVIRECVDINRALGNGNELANRLSSLGLVEESDGNLAEARALYEESLRISRVVDNKAATARALFNLAYNLCREGNFTTAAQYFEESLVICRELDDSHLTTMLLLNMGEFALRQQDYVKAHEYYKEALILSLSLKNKRVTAVSILGISIILYDKSLYKQSAKLHGFAFRLLDEIGAKLNQQDAGAFYQTVQTLKSAVGETVYQKESDVGRTLQLEQAIEIALPGEWFDPSMQHQ